MSDEDRPKMPPPSQRMIQLPGEGPLPPELRGKLPGMPPAGPGATMRSAPIDTSKDPIRAVVTFYEPPGLEDQAPIGVFWQTPSGIAMSPFVDPPTLVLAPGEEPPEGAKAIPLEGFDDPELESEHQAGNVHSEDES